eukprot:Nitzschia sp. Nitz4//NODE_159_length_47236_cov_74.723851//45231//46799//NITZ4_additional_000017-RA//1//CDS//3329531770//833//frame0
MRAARSWYGIVTSLLLFGRGVTAIISVSTASPSFAGTFGSTEQNLYNETTATDDNNPIPVDPSTVTNETLSVYATVDFSIVVQDGERDNILLEDYIDHLLDAVDNISLEQIELLSEYGHPDQVSDPLLQVPSKVQRVNNAGFTIDPDVSDDGVFLGGACPASIGSEGVDRCEQISVLVGMLVQDGVSLLAAQQAFQGALDMAVLSGDLGATLKGQFPYSPIWVVTGEVIVVSTAISTVQPTTIGWNGDGFEDVFGDDSEDPGTMPSDGISASIYIGILGAFVIALLLAAVALLFVVRAKAKTFGSDKDGSGKSIPGKDNVTVPADTPNVSDALKRTEPQELESMMEEGAVSTRRQGKNGASTAASVEGKSVAGGSQELSDKMSWYAASTLGTIESHEHIANAVNWTPGKPRVDVPEIVPPHDLIIVSSPNTVVDSHGMSKPPKTVSARTNEMNIFIRDKNWTAVVAAADQYEHDLAAQKCLDDTEPVPSNHVDVSTSVEDSIPMPIQEQQDILDLSVMDEEL